MMDWLFEADRYAERRFPWISIPGVASNCLLVRRVVCGRLAWITNYGSKKILEQMELTLDLLGLYV